MDEIKSLVKITANEYSNIKQLFPNTNRNNKEGLFYYNLVEDLYRDDKQASNDLYGSGPNDIRYKMLKVRLKRKLFNKLFFFDYNKHKLTKSHSKEQYCLQQLYHAHLLYRLQEFNLVLTIASKVKKIAIAYEYSNFVIDALELELSCCSEKGDINKFNSLRIELDAYFRLKKYEREATTVFELFILKLKKSVKSRKSNLEVLKEEVVTLQQLWQRVSTFDTFRAYYRANILYHEMIGDFASIIDLTVESESLLKEGKVNPMRFDATFNKFILVYAHFRDKKLDAGLKYASEFLNEFEEGSRNWFAHLENYFLIALHDKKYELAGNLLHLVFSNTSYTSLPASAKERWTIYQAYYLAINITATQGATITNPFILHLPEYSKDKQGFNVAILVLQFVYYLQKKETEALLYRIESLKKYINTHLKDSFSLRSKIFLKLLILTVTEDFNVALCQKKGLKLYQKLMETPTPGDAYAEIEIVPYEHLWEQILNILDQYY